MEALRGATYEELVDSGVRPVHAKLILSSLGTKSAAGPLPDGLAPSSQGSDEVLHFLRSIGLENCEAALSEAGYGSLDKLGEASMQDLLDAGLKTVHARLIASNLDSASTAGIAMTPAAQRLASIDDEESLLGAPKKKRPKRIRLICCALLALLAIGALVHSLGGASGAAATPPALTAGDSAGSDGAGGGGEPGEDGGKHKGGIGGGHHGGEGGKHKGGSGASEGGGGLGGHHGKSSGKPKPME